VVDNASSHDKASLRGVTIRQATVDDIPDLVRLRRMMFESMGFDDPAKLDAGDAAAADYFAKAIPSGEFLGWLAVTPEGEAVSTSGLVIDQHPPGPGNLSGKTGYIMNVVTHPAYRRRGLARRLVQAALASLNERGDIQRAELHATDMGRPLYEDLGFLAHTGMRLEMHK
jgi:ribosomal protein S18 acetylase RimI-like enzyme